MRVCAATNASLSLDFSILGANFYRFLVLSFARAGYYPPPPVDEHGRFPWEVAAAAASGASGAAAAPAYGADPNSFDMSAYGYAQPQQSSYRKKECTVCKRTGHDYKTCPNKKSRDEADTVYITGLPPTVTEKELIDLFGSIGIIATDKKTQGKKVKVRLAELI